MAEPCETALLCPMTVGPSAESFCETCALLALEVGPRDDGWAENQHEQKEV